MLISPVLAWFLAGIFFYVVEMTLPGFIIFFFGLGAWCVAVVLTLVKISLTTQLVIFLLCSLTSLILLRTKLRTIFHGGVIKQDDSVTIAPAPATGKVIEAITPPAMGRVKFGGSFWTATSNQQIPAGTVVTIVKKKDLTLNVRPLEPGKE